jgi:phage terminase small subunit
MTNAPLTPKQEAFCRAYVETGNASEAYRRSYDASKMAPATINRRATELLANSTIRARVQALQEGHQKRHELTVDRVIGELTSIAFASAGDFFDWGPGGVRVKDKSQLTPEQLAVVSEVSQTITEAGGTIRVKLHSKLDALDKLARHLGLYKELRLHEHTIKDADDKPVDPLDLARRILHMIDRLGSPAGERDPPAANPSTKH